MTEEQGAGRAFERPARRPVIAGNWKMHLGPSRTRAYLDRFLELLGEAPPPVVLFPPSISLTTAADCLAGRDDVALGVQNIHWQEEGAFTGETSAPMARDAGARFCLVGHSERRHEFGETDVEVRRKLVAGLSAGLIPVLCVGETHGNRRAGKVAEVILGQLDVATTGLPEDQLTGLMIAYEPVWAIGTGETATPADASEAHGFLRARLTERLGGERAAAVPILYGGSVKPGNAGELLSAEGVDGVLVGGASVDPESFAAIVAAGRA